MVSTTGTKESGIKLNGVGYNKYMSYQLKVIRDYPIGFWPLDEVSGTNAADRSGCGNDGTYVGSPATNILPIIPGGDSGTKITNTAYITLPIDSNYYASSVTPGMGTKYSSDNDFTMEVWIHQSIESTSVTPLFADNTNKIGLYWDRGDIVFKVSADDEIRYRVSYSQKSFHLVGVYSVNSISLYIDGIKVAGSEITSGFKFTNTTLGLQIGPTLDSGDSFIVDAPAIYRYSLPDTSITRHYNDGNISAPAIQVAKPDEGILFTCTDAKIRSSFQYGYPLNKLWPEFLDTNTYYNSQDGYISFYKTATAEAKQFIILDSFAIPTQIDFISSKVEWRNDLNITVESSLDGVTYVSCVNGQPLPQFTKDSFAVTSKVYLKITMSTTDASKYLPRLEFFNINFYTEKDLYADNYGDYITSTTEYYLGSLNYPILSRTFNNGIRAKAGAGFNIVTTNAVKSIELFLTPSDLTASTLFYCPVQGSYASAKYAWNSSGVISKTNIAKIYVNGVDKTTQTNISNYLVAEEPHHIVLVFTNPVSGSIQFNYQSSGGPSTLYKNITTYEKELTQTIVTEHYNLYTGKPSTVVSEPSITVTENTFKYYNNDWVVIQSK